MDAIDSIRLDGTMEHDCSPDSILPRILSGQLVIVRQCLQGLGIFESLRDLVIDGVSEVCGQSTADRLRRDGVEQIHQHVEADRIMEIYMRTRRVLAEKMPSITAQMFRQAGAQDRFYVHDSSLIRLMLPYDVQKQKQREFKSEIGKLTLHGPHHDHYQNVPVNALNSWIAISRVQHENGMFIFPEIWGKNLPKGKAVVREDQYLGRPYSFELDPGDALLFHSHHMHSSRLNTTSETRVVLTNRVCLEKPIYPDPTDPQKYFHSTAFPTDLDCSQIFAMDGFVGNDQQYIKTGMRRRLHGTARKLGFTRNTLPAESSNTKQIPGVVQEQFSSLAEGEIAALDKKTCVTRIGGQVVSFRRHCPHEGADLALGFVSDGQIVCPYHGVSFCPKTGDANCSAVARLRTETLSQDATRKAG